MEQYIERPWGVSVFGAGSVFAEPEVARLRLAVDLTRPTAGDAFDTASAAVGRFRAAVRRHGVPDAKVSGSRLRLNSAYDGYGANRRFLGYSCRSDFVIETEALDSVQRLIVDAIEAGAEHVESVAFGVRDEAALRDDARRRAVRAARRKAEVFAVAAGAALGPVVHIEDLDPERLAEGPRLLRSIGEDEGGSDGNLAPGLVEVSAGVVLGYALGR